MKSDQGCSRLKTDIINTTENVINHDPLEYVPNE